MTSLGEDMQCLDGNSKEECSNSNTLNGEIFDPSEAFLDNLLDFAIEEAENEVQRRLECERCRRPMTVCWCPFLPSPPVEVTTTVYILQHPLEELRKLRTAPMLLHSLSDGKCHIIKGKNFSKTRYPDLASMFELPNTLLLYPDPDAIDVRELSPLEDGYNLVILDGTWTQAKGMYLHNPLLHVPKKVKIVCDTKSKYVIRTQPTDGSLSTLESAALAMSVLEQRPELAEVLTKPLEALCDFQLAHGAVGHQSKEYRIEQGLWDKPLRKKIIKRREKERLQQEQEDR